MKDKVLIKLHLPQIDLIQEVWIPDFLTIRDIITMLEEIVSNLTKGVFVADEEMLLCEKECGRPLALDKTPKTLGLENGMEFLLI